MGGCLPDLMRPRDCGSACRLHSPQAARQHAAHRHRHLPRSVRQRRRCSLRCWAEDEASSKSEQAGSRKGGSANTIASLNALLGVDEEEEKRKEQEEEERRQRDREQREGNGQDASTSGQSDRPQQSAKMEEEVEKMKAKATDKEAQSISDLFQKLQTGKLDVDDEEGMRQMIQEAAKLVTEPVPKEVLQAAKTRILGTSSFLTTDTAPTPPPYLGGVALKGNCKIGPAEARAKLEAGLQKSYPDQFYVYLLPDADAAEATQADGKPRVQLAIVPRATGEPRPAAGWQVFLGAVLFFLTLGSTVSLGALVAAPKLPSETLAWLANADQADAALKDIPGLGDVDALFPFVTAFSDMFGGVVAATAAHDLGHAVAAAVRKLKLGFTLYVPNGSLGTFGSVTSVKKPVATRAAMWDFAAAGPILGLLASASLFTAGLALSADINADPNTLIPVPEFLFQGSIALGTVCETVLGPASGGKQLVHPMLIAGWCGLLTQAFNLMPVGCLDGGRMMLAAYGRNPLNVTSILTYLGLALSVIGGPMSLPFGLFVIFAQRDPEFYVQDQVTGTGNAREVTTALLVLAAFAILIPFRPDAPEVLDSMSASIQAQLLSAPPPDASGMQI